MRALEVFVEVADQGSLAGAARALLLSPPSVTRIVGQLEEELGVLLLHRTTRAITLTEPGTRFLESARRLLHDYQDAQDAIRGGQLTPKGVLRITAPVLFGQHYVTPLLLEFLDRHPDVSVEATFLDRIVNLVEEGFDLAVRIGPLPDSSLTALRVGEVRRVVCGHERYLKRHGAPQTPAELSAHKIVAARPIASTSHWRFAEGWSVKVKPRLSCSSVSAAIAAAMSGWGLTRVLSYQIGPQLKARKLKTVLETFEPEALPIHLVHAQGRGASAKVRAFVDMASSRLCDDPRLQGRD